jgi:hypothetical protein
MLEDRDDVSAFVIRHQNQKKVGRLASHRERSDDDEQQEKKTPATWK